MNTLVEIASNPKAADAARVQASNSILDRAWGKPIQTSKNLNVGMSYYDFLVKIVDEEKRGEGQSLFD